MDRFWEKVEKTDTCWNWIAGDDGKGYGRFGLDGVTVQAHRLSWQFIKGEIPAGMNVNHHCDNPSCVNPDHLYIGSQKQNIHDMIRRGRRYQPNVSGERNGRSKLTQRDADDIRDWFEQGNVSKAFLGRVYGVTPQQILSIIRGESWVSDDKISVQETGGQFTT